MIKSKEGRVKLRGEIREVQTDAVIMLVAISDELGEDFVKDICKDYGAIMKAHKKGLMDIRIDGRKGDGHK